jgi:transcription elongation factor GreA
VTPEESDPAQGLISTTSPVGKSLMGKHEGDEVVVRTPAGARNFEVRQMRTLHDDLAAEQ